MIAPPGDPRIARARTAARRYRALGWNPLPSRTDKKAPALRSYAKERDEGLPATAFDRLATCNIQLATGVRWGLCVVDLDGETPMAAWADMARFRPDPPTWRVVTREADGRVRGIHLWYGVPPGVDALPSRNLFGIWDDAANQGRGAWSRRSLIEFKGDRGLVIAPPSTHTKTGMPYAFAEGCGPGDLPRPATLPAWVLALPDLRPPVAKSAAIVPALSRRPASVRFEGPGVRSGGRFDRARVVEAIGDKASLVASWGLRLAGSKISASGWVECHAIDREDRNPSASFCPDRGLYWQPDYAKPISLFDLGVALGAYATWQDAVSDLGARFGVRPDPVANFDLSAPLVRTPA